MNRHKVFISYHHTEPDQSYRNQFENIFVNNHDIMVSKSVQIGEIVSTLRTETIRQKIRDEYLSDSTVTIVLIGTLTWQRKHVDWEISSSIRATLNSSRSGLLGIFLPSYPLSSQNKFNTNTIPPRLYDNWKDEKKRFAGLYNWSLNPLDIQKWIHEAFDKRDKMSPDNSYEHFSNNKTSDHW